MKLGNFTNFNRAGLSVKYWRFLSKFLVGALLFLSLECNVKEIPLTQGKVALVDDEDYEWLNSKKWYCLRLRNGDYAYRRFILCGRKYSKHIAMHRYILIAYGYKLRRLQVDHINGNSLDNRKCNLRPCTPGQNMMNKKTLHNNTSGYRGVAWRRDRNKWRARIMFKRKEYCLGHFNNKEDAIYAYNKKAVELFGDFARLNKEEGYDGITYK